MGGVAVMLANFKQAVEEVFPSRKKNDKPDNTKRNARNHKESKSSDLSDGSTKTTLITESTVIHGSIITGSNIEIAGEIRGDIESTNKVLTVGKVYGNIKCKNAEISGAYVEGNITVGETLTVGKGSVIVGDVSANRGVIGGKITGDVIMKLDVEIQKDALVIGDISADSASVEKGAVIQGRMDIGSQDAKVNISGSSEESDTVLINPSPQLV
jgi:cytoskeletal protein CcmA (bactofilin family)